MHIESLYLVPILLRSPSQKPAQTSGQTVSRGRRKFFDGVRLRVSGFSGLWANIETSKWAKLQGSPSFSELSHTGSDAKVRGLGSKPYKVPGQGPGRILLDTSIRV